MAAGLFTNDPIIAQNFFLEIDGAVISSLTSVTGLDIEVAPSALLHVLDGQRAPIARD